MSGDGWSMVDRWMCSLVGFVLTERMHVSYGWVVAWICRETSSDTDIGRSAIDNGKMGQYVDHYLTCEEDLCMYGP